MKLVYSDDKVAIIRAAREKKMTDSQILTNLVANEYGDAAPAPMGLTEDEALAAGRKAGLLKR